MSWVRVIDKEAVSAFSLPASSSNSSTKMIAAFVVIEVRFFILVPRQLEEMPIAGLKPIMLNNIPAPSVIAFCQITHIRGTQPLLTRVINPAPHAPQHGYNATLCMSWRHIDKQSQDFTT